MKRERETFPIEEVARIWAMQTQERARDRARTGNYYGRDWTNGSRFYFEHETIYSYGPHFAIAKLIESHGKRVALVTTRTYSMTTSGHVRTVRTALCHAGIEAIRCYDPSDPPSLNFDHWKAEIRAQIRLLVKARKLEMYLAQIMYSIDQAQTYADAIGVECPNLLAGLEINRRAGSDLIWQFETLVKLRVSTEALRGAMKLALGSPVAGTLDTTP